MSTFDEALLKEVPIHQLVGVRRVHPAINAAAGKVYYENSILNKLSDQRFFEGAKLKKKVSDAQWELTNASGRPMTLHKLPNGQWRLDVTAFNTPASVLHLLDGDTEEIMKLTNYSYYFRVAQLGEVASILPVVRIDDEGRIDLSETTINGIPLLELPDGQGWNIVLQVVCSDKFDTSQYNFHTTVENAHGAVVIDDEMEEGASWKDGDALTFDPDFWWCLLQVQFKYGEDKIGSRYINLKTELK